MASITNSTMKQYNSHLKEWWSFCMKKSIDVYAASTNDIVEFLTTRFNERASYSTLKCARSAINILYKRENTESSLITCFFKGIFNLKPLRPKYEEIWNTDKILNFIESLGPIN